MIHLLVFILRRLSISSHRLPANLLLLFFVISIFPAICSAFCTPIPFHRKILGNSNPSSSCPVDFQYVRRFPSTLGACRGGDDATVCCPALFSILGIAISQFLASTGVFEFPDNATAFACLAAYQQQLQANAIAKDFLSTCFPVPFPDPAMFIQSPTLCAGITTTQDWTRIVGASPMDTSCKGDLSSDADCQICTDDVKQVVYRLNTISANHSDCVYFSVIYAAGAVNSVGPLDPSTAACLLGTNSNDRMLKKHHKKTAIFAAVGGGIVGLLSCLLAMSFRFWRRRNQKAELESLLEERNRMLASSLASNTGLVQFPYDQLKAATQDFDPGNVIGEGGFGRVYRGLLASKPPLQIAVKIIKNTAADDGDAEFLNEVEVINRVRHRNLLPLRGCCIAASTLENHHRILVYDYMPNGNLENYLFIGSKTLSWPERRKIAIGTATGINYLHNEVDPAIIHRDIKPSNILLDAELNAKVADFGLAKVAPEGISHLTTRVAGTPVYIALEYAMYGHLSEKIDVYSFGIVLLELMSGRRALDTTLENPSDYHIVDWAWRLVKQERAAEVIDKSMRDGGNNPMAVMERFVYVGILCAHLVVTFRPPISQVLKMLEGDCEIPPIPDRPLPFAWAQPTDALSAYSLDSSASGSAHPSINSIDLLR